MDMQELEITLAPDGTIRVAVKGVTGPGCLGVTEGLERALGTVTERTFTSAAFESGIPQEDQARNRNRKI